MWYLSLILAVVSLATAAQHSSVIQALLSRKHSSMAPATIALRNSRSILNIVAIDRGGPAEMNGDNISDSDIDRQVCASRMMIYVFQNPVMLMAYSWVTFMTGLMLRVISPLGKKSWQNQNDRRTAVFVLISGGIIFLNFAWCSFWWYRAVKDEDTGDLISVAERATLDEEERGQIADSRR